MEEQEHTYKLKHIGWLKNLTRKVLHKLIGHLPYYVYTTPHQADSRLEGETVYKCYWCNAELKKGMWAFLYDKDGTANP